MEAITAVGLVGRSGTVAVRPEVRVPVRIIGVRTAYGRWDLEVEPIGGSGRWWVLAERVEVWDADK